MFQPRDQKLKDLKAMYADSLKENLKLLTKIDSVDWNLYAQAEERVAGVLREFQRTVEAVVLSMEEDIKKWKK